MFQGSGYNPVEGFIFCADFMMTKTSRFEDLTLRYSVYLVGQKLTKTYYTEEQISEEYSQNVKRVFIGEQQKIEDIEPDPETFLIIEAINSMNIGGNKKKELVGWTMVKLFDEHEGLIQQKWVIPLYMPPTQFSATPNQMVSNLQIVDGTKLFVRISHPRNDSLLYKIRKQDPLDTEYQNSPFYLILHRTPKFYKEWKERLKKKRAKAKQLADDMRDELEMIKKYLDDEDKFIEDENKREEDVTKKELAKVDDEMKKEQDKILEPMKKLNNDIERNVKEFVDDKKKGKEAKDKYDKLDDNDGPKTGLKITFNNVFNVKSKRTPLKIEFDVYMKKELLFDEFGNPCQYLLPLIDGHIDYSTLSKVKKRKRKRLDVEVDEIWYVVKDIKGLIKEFNFEQSVYLVFHLYEVKEENGPVVNEEEEKPKKKKKKKKRRKRQNAFVKKLRAKYKLKEAPYSYKVFEKKSQIGWKIFEVTFGKEKEIKIGRYKEELLKTPSQKPPIDYSKRIRNTGSWIDFTIETFEYESFENRKFAFRRRRQPKNKNKDGDIYDRRAFIPNDEIQYLDEPFVKGSGIDFYVDSARYLPTSVTVTKILVRIVDSNLSNVVNSSSKVSNFRSDVFKPKFGFRLELRLPFFNPTLMAIVTLFTSDVNDDEGSTSIVGHAFFPFFIDRRTGRQPEDQANKVKKFNFFSMNKFFIFYFFKKLIKKKLKDFCTE